VTARVRRILLYPIKSLDPVSVAEARVLPGGALERDREFAIVDAGGQWINAKREPRIHRIRAEYDLPGRRVSLRAGAGEAAAFHLDADREGLEEWLGGFLGIGARLERNAAMGFPDDTDSPGPTVVSRETFDAVGAWFGIAADEAGRRFRSNIEVAAGAAFWEDGLVSESGEPVAFQIGEDRIHGINPCLRCPVPSRNPDTGAVDANFQREFVARRQAALPAWAPPARFNPFYRLSVNTRIPPSEAGKTIRVGDAAALR
jgi:uncharacterized protein YcbX